MAEMGKEILSSFWSFLVARLTLAWIPLVMFFSFRFLGTGLSVLMCLATFVFLWTVTRGIAYVIVDEKGVYVTRYFRRRFVGWEHVTSVHYSLRERGLKFCFNVSIDGLKYATSSFSDSSVIRAVDLLAKVEKVMARDKPRHNECAG